MLGIAERMHHRPAELSGGEQQRVALARALINRPAIVLADEPTGNLDSENSEIVLRMLRQSNQDLGQTVLMITHNPEAARYGDRILHMRDGKMVPPEKDPQWAPRATLLKRAIVSFASILAADCPALSGLAIIQELSGSNSAVECDLAKVEVAGSNPVSRSSFCWFPRAQRGLMCVSLGRGTQVVRERSAKPLYVSSILTRASTLPARNAS